MTYKEEILTDDYPVYPGYLYVADGRVVVSMLEGTVRDLKRKERYTEVRSCDIVGRQKRAASS